MKSYHIFCGLLLTAVIELLPSEVFPQTFKNIGQAKEFFEKLDDAYNKAMVTKDSLFFKSHFAEGYINCTPVGTIENKEQEIQVLLSLPLTQVERVAPRFTVFTYANNLATFSVVKKLTKKDASIAYVRRTTIYQLINGKWQSVSGQGTSVLARYIE